MKNISIGLGMIVLLLVGAFVLTGSKNKKNMPESPAPLAQEAAQKTYPKIRQDYTPPVSPEYVPQNFRQVVTPPSTPSGEPFVAPKMEEEVIPQAPITNESPVIIPSFEKEEVITEPEPVIETPEPTPTPITQKGSLKNYTAPSDLAHLTGTNILFFKASWCITCTMLYDKLKEEQNAIPDGVTIWVVNYDSNESMRRSYGVTSQHTLVQIDTNKNKINLWRGGFSLAEVLSNIK